MPNGLAYPFQENVSINILGVLCSIFHFSPNSKRAVCKQAVETLTRAKLCPPTANLVDKRANYIIGSLLCHNDTIYKGMAYFKVDHAQKQFGQYLKLQSYVVTLEH